MRTVYATNLEFNSQVTEDIEKRTLSWITSWYKKHRVTLAIDIPADGASKLIEAKPRHSLKISTITLGNERVVEFLWVYPDVYDKSLEWHTNVTIHSNSEKCFFNISLSIESVIFVINPVNLRLGAPKIVEELTELQSAMIGGFEINNLPEKISARNISDLVSLLLDSERTFPVIILTPLQKNENYIVSGSDLRKKTAGIAKVYELSDKWAVAAFMADIGRDLACFGGAIRLYWPKFTKASKNFQHPLWLPADNRDNELIERDIFTKVATASAFRQSAAAMVVENFKNKYQQHKRELARQTTEQSEDKLLADIVAAESSRDEYSARYSESRAEIERNQQEIAALKNHIKEQNILIADLKNKQPSDSQESTTESLPPTSVIDAVNKIKSSLKYIILIESAFTSAKDSPFKQPERVIDALEAIDDVADAWAKSLRTKTSVGTFKELFRERGFDYKDDISKTTLNRWGDEYKAAYKDESISIAPHLTIGAKQADTCLSIHFNWHQKDGRVIVAHIGRHKTNTKT